MARYVHVLIKKTAEEMAGCFYEEAAHDNQFYYFYPNVKKFIKREYKRFIKPARAMLAQMLGMNHVSQALKDEIHEALLLDRSLPQGNAPSAPPQQPQIMH